MGRGKLPAAGPVACGGLWVMTAVDSNNSISIAVMYVAHPYIGRGYEYCCRARGVPYILLYTTSIEVATTTYIRFSIDRPASHVAHPRSCAYDNHKKLLVRSRGVVVAAPIGKYQVPRAELRASAVRCGT